jgi:hypothetical protein
VTRPATLGESARVPGFSASLDTLVPSQAFTWASELGEWWTPPAASVAKASVISSGETPSGPSVIEQTGSSGDWIPIRCATSTTACGPTFVTTCAKIVFTENAVACSSDIVPCASSA